MARVALLACIALTLLPTAAAWEATFVSSPSEVSLAESLLLAGAIDATAPDGAFFGAPYGVDVTFDGPVDVRVCPDQAGEPQTSPQCAQNEDTTGVLSFYVLAGGVVAQAPNGVVELSTRATAAALGGPNVTLNEQRIGMGIVVGGPSVITAQDDALILRPLLANASIEVRGNEGFRIYNGTAYTMFVSGSFNTTTLEARGAFLASSELEVRVARAGLVPAETELSVEQLFATLREIQAPERADRRAAVAGAFGPFQLVPALLDGAAAARVNLTLNGGPRGAFTFVRLEDGRFAHDGVNWTGSGNASYMVDDDAVAQSPGKAAKLPIALPIALVVLALAARYLTIREPIARRRRYVALAIRLGGLVLLSFLVASTLAPLLGFSPLLDARSLSLRSRVQLALLNFGMVAIAYVGVGLPIESLVRSLLAWRKRATAIVVPVLVGLAATLVLILVATPALLSFVARSVRL